jgi:hypothetical protein
MAMAAGCAAPPEPIPTTTIDNPELDLTIADLPVGWTVRENDGRTLALAPSQSDRRGLVTVRVGPEEHGINLVALVEEHRRQIEGRPDGTYAGAQELSGPLGVAFYSRGRFTREGEAVEETRIFAIHPAASRPLELEYTYPAAEDSSARVSELIDLFARIE